MLDNNQNQSNIGYKYDFEIKISSMKIEYKLPFNFRLLFKRGNKQTEIEKTFKYDPTSLSEISINETFTISCIMKADSNKFDFSNPIFSEKKYKMYVCIYTKTGFKPAISGEFNLADFVSDKNDKIKEMVISNKTFSTIKIKYAINSAFISQCDLEQLSNEINQTADISKLDNQEYASGNTGSNNTGKEIAFNANINANANNNKENDRSEIIKENVINNYENSKKFEDRIPALNSSRNDNNINNKNDNNSLSNISGNTGLGNAESVIPNLNVSNAGSSNKIKITLKTATNSNNNLMKLDTDNDAKNPNNNNDSNLNKTQNGFLEIKNEIINTNNSLNNKELKQMQPESLSEEKAKEFEDAISNLQNKLAEEVKEKQELMESQRKRDLEFISLVEENEYQKIEIANFKEQEISMLDELSKLKADVDNYFLENKQLQLKNDSMLQKIEYLNSSVLNLNETVKDLKSKANTASDNNQTSNSFVNNDALNEQLEEKDRIITEIRAENEYQNDEINLLKSVVEDLKKEKKQLFEEKNEQVIKLKSQIDEANNSNYDIKKSNDQNLKLISQLKAEIKQLSEENEDLRNKKKNIELSLKSEIDGNKQKIRDAQKESQNERDQIHTKANAELDALKANYIKLLDEKEEEIHNIRSLLSNNEGTTQLEKQGLENLIKNLNREIQILEEQLNSKENELQSLKECEDINTGGLKSQINEYLIAISQKDSQLKESKSEINSLTNNLNSLEEKLKILSYEKDGQLANLMESEKKLKDNIILYKQKLEEKDNYMQIILDEKEKLRYECEKLMSEIKNAEKTKTNDEDLMNQINQIQLKAAEKERKILDEKDQEIRLLRREFESSKLESKKTNANNSERENTKTQNEILFLKKEIEILKAENKEAKQFKENMLKLERTIIDLQNNLAIKKVEISQCENEKEKLNSENRKIVMEINEQKNKIDNLEKDLVFTKQKLGDVLNELGEYENNNNTNTTLKTEKSLENIEKKKAGFSSFFSKKKKDN